MNILTISEEQLRGILDEKFQYFECQIENLSNQNIELKNTIAKFLKKSNPSEKLTTKEVASICKVKESTVRDWCRKDRIIYERTGDKYRIRRQDLEQFMKGH